MIYITGLFSVIKLNSQHTSQKGRKAKSKHHTNVSFQLQYNDKHHDANHNPVITSVQISLRAENS